jgi:hypothetical protein
MNQIPVSVILKDTMRLERYNVIDGDLDGKRGSPLFHFC